MSVTTYTPPCRQNQTHSQSSWLIGNWSLHFSMKTQTSYNKRTSEWRIFTWYYLGKITATFWRWHLFAYCQSCPAKCVRSCSFFYIILILTTFFAVYTPFSGILCPLNSLLFISPCLPPTSIQWIFVVYVLFVRTVCRSVLIPFLFATVCDFMFLAFSLFIIHFLSIMLTALPVHSFSTIQCRNSTYTVFSFMLCLLLSLFML